MYAKLVFFLGPCLGIESESKSKPKPPPTPKLNAILFGLLEAEVEVVESAEVEGTHLQGPGRPFCVFDKFVAACPGPDHVLIVQKRRQQNVSLLSSVDGLL